MSEYIRTLSEGLRRTYPYKCELHAHTKPVSSCSEIVPEKLIGMYAEEGFSTVCITNHLARGRSDDADYYLRDYFEAAEAGKKLGVNVILGAELRFPGAENDYLVFGITPEDLPGIIAMLDMDLPSFSSAWRREDRLLLQAHPFRNGMTEIDRSLVDGIEAFNSHPHHNSRVALASRTAHAEGLPFVAGTDFHHPGHQGLAATLSRFPLVTGRDVVDLIRSGDFLSEVGGSLIIP